MEDVADRLLERRIVLFTGPLDHSSSSHAAAQLMLLDAAGDGPIDLRMSCPDGDLDAALALADTVELLGVELRVCAVGAVGGPALAPYVAASHRAAHPHATFTLRNPTVSFSGRARDLETQVDQHQRQLASLHARLAAATVQPLHRIASDMGKGVVLSAKRALAYGLVQALVGSGDL